ncbi:hypothetical protein SAMN05660479_03337 [Microbulbifer thermotolerans]|uniref:Uncharacterized protein n=1 Tax=Microbulbifer thermotolerans TaxID=252514 RepID=A0AB35I3V2_MICTH|nr:hypothetical protein [Microbulbifer thermotolerans]MCX2803372.1 hypothetical protein [Microbulbifer thermotolerans]MCX2836402.1 hypothetical protein [Microbulbifer thermotolerans]MCX2843188.1 hypothetical protein [Microbulbifer thermotolerans]SFD16656.1 hypothetical protein SAMN05660479_03337 [Microbulbifer thermotolerans]
MRAFGYESGGDKLLTISEVTLQASPEELRKLAKFVEKCAAEMDEDENWEHEHYSEYVGVENSSIECDLIVFKP